MEEMHSLLKRQIRKNFGDRVSVPKEWRSFLEAVNEAYKEYDNDCARLERSLEISTQEHAQSTAQMLKVREMALGIESQMTLIDVISFVVESARDISGVRFALLQRLDESGQYVITPYCSKARPDNVLKLLSAVGFKVENYLGEGSTSGKLRFEVAKMKAIQDFLRNHKTIVMEKLSGLLDGVWPGTLCDSIQKILGFRQIVVTALLVEGKFWGSLVFFLDSNVPQNYLEMIAAHCALGIRNVLTLEERIASEQMVRATIEAVTEGIITTDIQDFVTDVNEAALKIYGNSSKQELIGRKASDLIVEENRSVSFRNIVKTQEQEQIRDIACKLRRSDGQLFDAELNTATIKDAAGNLKSFVISIRDITERKRADEALKESERKYQLIAENTVDYIAILTFKGIYTYLSPSHQKFGYDLAEMVGKSGLDFIHPEDKKHLLPLLTKYARMKLIHLLRLKTQNFSQTIVYRLRDASGEWHDMEANGSLIESADGKGLRILMVSRDVTENKRAGDKLRYSERRLKEAQTLGKIGSYEYDLVTNNVIWSDEMYELFERDKNLRPPTAEEIPGYFLPDEFQKFGELRITAVDTGKEAHHDVTVKLPSGNTPIFYVSIRPMKDDKGQIVKLFGIIQDVTERRQAIDTLLRNKNRLDEAQKLTHVGSFEWDIKSGKNDWSAELFRILGLTPENTVPSYELFSNMIHPNDREFVTKFIEIALSQCHISPIEFRIVRPDGQERNIFSNIQINHDNSGKPLTLIGTSIDITERKQAELQIRAQKALTDRILASTPDAVAVFGQDRRVIMANEAFALLFELTKGKAEGQELISIIHIPQLVDSISQIMDSGESQFHAEYRHKLRTRERILVVDIISMQNNEVLIILRDVTDDREMRERLFLTDRLVSVGEMASGIAHELNNPLTGIIGLSQLLLELHEENPDEVKEDLKMIYSEAQRAAEVVKNLLTFARRHEQVTQAVQINGVIEDVLKLRAYELKVNNIYLTTCFDKKLPEIKADQFQMQQVFLNLVLNAEQAMIEAHGKGTLTITTGRVDNKVIVTFSDDGPGISPVNMRKLFSPFFTTKEVGKGTGLGLSISYGIVTNHGGRIYARSEPGKGATFVIELPVDKRQGGEDTNDSRYTS